MKDGFLVSLIAMAEAVEPVEMDVTLIVSGFLVSGYITSSEKYYEHHTVISSIASAISNIVAEEGEPLQNNYNFIHLRDARYFSGGNNKPIPNNMGVFVRISLEAVHGFSLGKLQAE